MNKSAYIAFTAPSYRILNASAALLFLLIGFLASVYIGTVGVVLVSSFAPVVLVFMDFFAFSGTSARKQRTMNFLKSSYKGAEFFRKALKTDLILKEVYLLTGFLGFFLAEIIYFSDAEAFINSLLIMIVYLPIGEITMHIALIISRRIALSIAVQTGVCYVCSMISTFLLLIYSFAMPEDVSNNTVIIVIAFFVLEIINIVCTSILYKDCRKGYESSFTDT